MPPADVRACTPSEVASILGLDLTDAVRAVPLEDAPFVPRTGTGERRLRTVF